MAIQFATELRAAAKQTGDLGERSLSDLRDILTDTLAKVRVEVFADTGSGDEGGSGLDADAQAARTTAMTTARQSLPPNRRARAASDVFLGWVRIEGGIDGRRHDYYTRPPVRSGADAPASPDESWLSPDQRRA